jgi:hypothetical protein
VLVARLQHLSAELERDGIEARRERARRRARLLAVEARRAVAEALAFASPDRQLCRGLLSDLDSADLLA